jgi:hypothetical protein
VDPQPGRLSAPVLDPGLALAQVGERLTAEEALLDVLHGAFDPRLVLRPAHPGRVGAEPAGLGVVQPARGERRVDRVGLRHHRGQVVRDQDREDPAKVLPGRLTPGDHRGQGLLEGQPHEHVPRVHRGEDQPVGHPAPARHRLRDQAEPAEVDLALHPRRPVGHPQRRRPGGEPAPLDREPVQRPVRHHDPAAGQLAVDVRQLQPVLGDPLGDPRLLRDEQLPRRAVPADPGRADRGHHRADQLVRQLLLPAVTDQPGRLPGLHIPAGRLAVHPGPLGRRPQPGTRQPAPQHLSHLDHTNLPERHRPPPDHSTWTNR